jgi:CDP-glucose 4,6-dehydratase
VALGDELGALANRRVLITGSSGFKGAWMSMVLQQLGATVLPFGSPLVNRFELGEYLGVQPDFQELDVTDAERVKQVFREAEPEIVLHLGAKVLVSESFERPTEYLRTNLLGTLNVFETALITDSVISGVHVSTDKVYAPSLNVHTEMSRIGGVFDPYSASKVAAEWALQELITSQSGKSKPIVVARGGNVIGGGDGNANRLMKDVWGSVKNSEIMKVRNPSHSRPWQHVLDCVCAYLMLALEAEKGNLIPGEAFNVSPGPESHTVEDLMILTGLDWQPADSEEHRNKLETDHLALDSEKLKRRIGWSHKTSFEESVRETMNWIRADFQGVDMYKYSMDSVMKFLSA